MTEQEKGFEQGTQPEETTSEPASEGSSERLSSFSRRALIHAGWTVPVIMTVAPPRAFAQSVNPNHTDGGTHGDSHDDHSDAHSSRG